MPGRRQRGGHSGKKDAEATFSPRRRQKRSTSPFSEISSPRGGGAKAWLSSLEKQREDVPSLRDVMLPGDVTSPRRNRLGVGGGIRHRPSIGNMKMLHQQAEDKEHVWSFDTLAGKIRKATIPHVLLACKNPLALSVNSMLLKRMKFVVEPASSGRKVVQLWQQDPGRYNVILIEVDLLEVSGHDAIRLIRDSEEHSRQPHTPAIALTSAEDDIKVCFDSGFDHFMRKPLSLHLKSLRELLLPYGHAQGKAMQAEGNFDQLNRMFADMNRQRSEDWDSMPTSPTSPTSPVFSPSRFRWRPDKLKRIESPRSADSPGSPRRLFQGSGAPSGLSQLHDQYTDSLPPALKPIGSPREARQQQQEETSLVQAVRAEGEAAVKQLTQAMSEREVQMVELRTKNEELEAKLKASEEALSKQELVLKLKEDTQRRFYAREAARVHHTAAKGADSQEMARLKVELESLRAENKSLYEDVAALGVNAVEQGEDVADKLQRIIAQSNVGTMKRSFEERVTYFRQQIERNKNDLMEEQRAKRRLQHRVQRHAMMAAVARRHLSRAENQRMAQLDDWRPGSAGSESEFGPSWMTDTFTMSDDNSTDRPLTELRRVCHSVPAQIRWLTRLHELFSRFVVGGKQSIRAAFKENRAVVSREQYQIVGTASLQGFSKLCHACVQDAVEFVGEVANWAEKSGIDTVKRGRGRSVSAIGTKPNLDAGLGSPRSPIQPQIVRWPTTETGTCTRDATEQIELTTCIDRRLTGISTADRARGRGFTLEDFGSQGIRVLLHGETLIRCRLIEEMVATVMLDRERAAAPAKKGPRKGRKVQRPQRIEPSDALPPAARDPGEGGGSAPAERSPPSRSPDRAGPRQRVREPVQVMEGNSIVVAALRQEREAAQVRMKALREDHGVNEDARELKDLDELQRKINAQRRALSTKARTGKRLQERRRSTIKMLKELEDEEHPAARVLRQQVEMLHTRQSSEVQEAAAGAKQLEELTQLHDELERKQTAAHEMQRLKEHVEMLDTMIEKTQEDPQLSFTPQFDGEWSAPTDSDSDASLPHQTTATWFGSEAAIGETLRSLVSNLRRDTANSARAPPRMAEMEREIQALREAADVANASLEEMVETYVLLHADLLTLLQCLNNRFSRRNTTSIIDALDGVDTSVMSTAMTHVPRVMAVDQGYVCHVADLLASDAALVHSQAHSAMKSLVHNMRAKTLRRNSKITKFASSPWLERMRREEEHKRDRWARRRQEILCARQRMFGQFQLDTVNVGVVDSRVTGQSAVEAFRHPKQDDGAAVRQALRFVDQATGGTVEIAETARGLCMTTASEKRYVRRVHWSDLKQTLLLDGTELYAPSDSTTKALLWDLSERAGVEHNLALPEKRAAETLRIDLEVSREARDAIASEEAQQLFARHAGVTIRAAAVDSVDRGRIVLQGPRAVCAAVRREMESVLGTRGTVLRWRSAGPAAGKLLFAPAATHGSAEAPPLSGPLSGPAPPPVALSPQQTASQQLRMAQRIKGAVDLQRDRIADKLAEVSNKIESSSFVEDREQLIELQDRLREQLKDLITQADASGSRISQMEQRVEDLQPSPPGTPPDVAARRAADRVSRGRPGVVHSATAQTGPSPGRPDAARPTVLLPQPLPSSGDTRGRYNLPRRAPVPSRRGDGSPTSEGSVGGWTWREVLGGKVGAKLINAVVNGDDSSAGLLVIDPRLRALVTLLWQRFTETVGKAPAPPPQEREQPTPPVARNAPSPPPSARGSAGLALRMEENFWRREELLRKEHHGDLKDLEKRWRARYASLMEHCRAVEGKLRQLTEAAGSVSLFASLRATEGTTADQRGGTSSRVSSPAAVRTRSPSPRAAGSARPALAPSQRPRSSSSPYRHNVHTQGPLLPLLASQAAAGERKTVQKRQTQGYPSPALPRPPTERPRLRSAPRRSAPPAPQAPSPVAAKQSVAVPRPASHQGPRRVSTQPLRPSGATASAGGKRRATLQGTAPVPMPQPAPVARTASGGDDVFPPPPPPVPNTVGLSPAAVGGGRVEAELAQPSPEAAAAGAAADVADSALASGVAA